MRAGGAEGRSGTGRAGRRGARLFDAELQLLHGVSAEARPRVQRLVDEAAEGPHVDRGRGVRGGARELRGHVQRRAAECAHCEGSVEVVGAGGGEEEEGLTR